MFPNRHSVYMHDTPHRELFADDVRAFSNGWHPAGEAGRAGRDPADGAGGRIRRRPSTAGWRRRRSGASTLIGRSRTCRLSFGLVRRERRGALSRGRLRSATRRCSRRSRRRRDVAGCAGLSVFRIGRATGRGGQAKRPRLRGLARASGPRPWATSSLPLSGAAEPAAAGPEPDGLGDAAELRRGPRRRAGRARRSSGRAPTGGHSGSRRRSSRRGRATRWPG